MSAAIRDAIWTTLYEKRQQPGISHFFDWPGGDPP